MKKVGTLNLVLLLFFCKSKHSFDGRSNKINGRFNCVWMFGFELPFVP